MIESSSLKLFLYPTIFFFELFTYSNNRFHDFFLQTFANIFSNVFEILFSHRQLWRNLPLSPIFFPKHFFREFFFYKCHIPARRLNSFVKASHFICIFIAKILSPIELAIVKRKIFISKPVLFRALSTVPIEHNRNVWMCTREECVS